MYMERETGGECPTCGAVKVLWVEYRDDGEAVGVNPEPPFSSPDQYRCTPCIREQDGDMDTWEWVQTLEGDDAELFQAALAQQYAMELTCTLCDGLGHGYPGAGPCPLEEQGYWDARGDEMREVGL